MNNFGKTLILCEDVLDFIAIGHQGLNPFGESRTGQMQYSSLRQGWPLMRDTDSLRSNMVNSQLRTNRVTDPRVLAAMGEVPRERFLPETHAYLAYADEDVPLGGGRVLLEPMVFARLVQALDITEDDVVLDIACGTGYSSMVLGRLARAVVALDSNADLIERATAIQADFTHDNVIFESGPLLEGWKAQAPYDVIFVNGAIECVPEAIVQQLAPGGRLGAVFRVGGRQGCAELVTMFQGVASRSRLFDANVPMLTEFVSEKGFTF